MRQGGVPHISVSRNLAFRDGFSQLGSEHGPTSVLMGTVCGCQCCALPSWLLPLLLDPPPPGTTTPPPPDLLLTSVCPAAEAGLSCVTPGWGLPTAPGWVAVSSAVSSHLPRRQKDFSVWPVTVKRPGVQGQFSPWVTSTWCGQCWVPKGRWGPCPVLVPGL